MFKRGVLYSILLVLVLAHLLFAINCFVRSSKKIPNNFGHIYSVLSIKILPTNTFEICLLDDKDEKTILGKPICKIKSGSRNKIINILNKSERPSVLLISRSEDCFVIDF